LQATKNENLQNAPNHQHIPTHIEHLFSKGHEVLVEIHGVKNVKPLALSNISYDLGFFQTQCKP